MTFIQYVYLYALAFPFFLAIDMIWLGVIAKNFYRSQLGDFLGPVQWPFAVIFYALFVVGILVFAVAPAITASSLGKAIVLGALFGFLAYATYDLTNLATLKDWPLTVSLVDMLWGATVSAVVASASFAVAQRLFLS